MNEKMSISFSSIKDAPTLHDFHVLFFDVSQIFEAQYWNQTDFSDYIEALDFFGDFKKKVDEQIKTGGITFIVSGTQTFHQFLDNKASWGPVGTYTEKKSFSNYFFCPIDLGIESEVGDTVYPVYDKLGVFKPLIRKVSSANLHWRCHFSKNLSDTKVLATNRAGYPIFIEIKYGLGKLIVLPSVRDNKNQFIQLIVDEIIPNLTTEQELIKVPEWVSSFHSPNELEMKGTLKKIQQTKQLLYTDGKALEKAVGFAFQLLGFEVERLPGGSYADLILKDGQRKAFVEVKGHENSQGSYRNICQLLGRLEEAPEDMKGIVVCNHEFSKEPSSRNKSAFTADALKVAERSGMCLVSSVDLFKISQECISSKSEKEAEVIRTKILETSGNMQL